MESTPQKKPPTIDFRCITPAKRRPTQYEEVTLHTQWNPKNFATQGWFSPSSDGRPMWSEDSTRLRANDWWGYRDPAQQWFRPYVDGQAKQEDAIELAVEGAKRASLFTEFTPAWREVLRTCYAAYRYLREDGKTFITQPVLDPKRMSTVDDVRRCWYEVVSPLRREGAALH